MGGGRLCELERAAKKWEPVFPKGARKLRDLSVLHLPRLRRALGDDVDHQFTVEPGAPGEMQTSESAWTSPAMQIWLTILVSCPAPEAPISLQDLA